MRLAKLVLEGAAEGCFKDSLYRGFGGGFKKVACPTAGASLKDTVTLDLYSTPPRVRRGAMQQDIRLSLKAKQARKDRFRV